MRETIIVETEFRSNSKEFYRKVSRDLDKVDRRIKEIRKEFVTGFKFRVGSSTLNMARGFITDITRVAGALASQFIVVNNTFEQLRIQLRNVTGSLEGGAAAFDYITQKATKVPYSINAIAYAFVQLKAAGVPNVTRHITSLTDALAAMGIGSEGFKLSVLAIRQMFGKTTVSLEELRRQLAEQIPVAMRAMATGLAVSVQQLTHDIKRGAVNATGAVDKMYDVFDKMFKGAAATRMNSFQGAVALFSNAWQMLLDDIGNGRGSFSSITGAIKATANALNNFRNSAEGAAVLQDISDYITTLMNKVTDNPDALRSLFNGVGTVAKNIASSLNMLSSTIQFIIDNKDTVAALFKSAGSLGVWFGASADQLSGTVNAGASERFGVRIDEIDSSNYSSVRDQLIELKQLNDEIGMVAIGTEENKALDRARKIAREVNRILYESVQPVDITESLNNQLETLMGSNSDLFTFPKFIDEDLINAANPKYTKAFEKIDNNLRDLVKFDTYLGKLVSQSSTQGFGTAVEKLEAARIQKYAKGLAILGESGVTQDTDQYKEAVKRLKYELFESADAQRMLNEAESKDKTKVTKEVKAIADGYKKAAKEARDLAYKRADIAKTMYTKLAKGDRRYTAQAVEAQKSLLAIQLQDYSEFITDKGLLEAYAHQQYIDLEKEKMLATGDFFDGMLVGLDDFISQMPTIADVGKETFGDLKEGWDDTWALLGETLVDGSWSEFFGSLEDIFSNVLKNMLAKWLTFLGEMVIAWAAQKFGTAIGGNIGSGVASLGAAFMGESSGGLGVSDATSMIPATGVGDGIKNWVATNVSEGAAEGLATVASGAALAGGAYGVYTGISNISDGNTGVGAVQTGVGGYSMYQGAVGLDLIEEGTATRIAQSVGQQLGFEFGGNAGGSQIVTYGQSGMQTLGGQTVQTPVADYTIDSAGGYAAGAGAVTYSTATNATAQALIAQEGLGWAPTVNAGTSGIGAGAGAYTGPATAAYIAGVVLNEFWNKFALNSGPSAEDRSFNYAQGVFSEATLEKEIAKIQSARSGINGIRDSDNSTWQEQYSAGNTGAAWHDSASSWAEAANMAFLDMISMLGENGDAGPLIDLTDQLTQAFSTAGIESFVEGLSNIDMTSEQAAIAMGLANEAAGGSGEAFRVLRGYLQSIGMSAEGASQATVGLLEAERRLGMVSEESTGSMRALSGQALDVVNSMDAVAMAQENYNDALEYSENIMNGSTESIMSGSYAMEQLDKAAKELANTNIDMEANATINVDVRGIDNNRVSASTSTDTSIIGSNWRGDYSENYDGGIFPPYSKALFRPGNTIAEKGWEVAAPLRSPDQLNKTEDNTKAILAKMDNPQPIQNNIKLMVSLNGEIMEATILDVVTEYDEHKKARQDGIVI